MFRYHHVTVLLYTWFSYSARNPGIVSHPPTAGLKLDWLDYVIMVGERRPMDQPTPSPPRSRVDQSINPSPHGWMIHTTNPPLSPPHLSTQYFVAMNYTVHAVMYSYYFLMEVKLWPKWLKCVHRSITTSMCMCMGYCLRFAACLSAVPAQPIRTHNTDSPSHPPPPQKSTAPCSSR